MENYCTVTTVCKVQCPEQSISQAHAGTCCFMLHFEGPFSTRRSDIMLKPAGEYQPHVHKHKRLISYEVLTKKAVSRTLAPDHASKGWSTMDSCTPIHSSSRSIQGRHQVTQDLSRSIQGSSQVTQRRSMTSPILMRKGGPGILKL